uniref:Uncharacterized protein n=1 Tax=Rhizophora mucronata TaxID=61149 RepID=A0A2P2JT62_RHIMU
MIAIKRGRWWQGYWVGLKGHLLQRLVTVFALSNLDTTSRFLVYILFRVAEIPILSLI